jgi:hypothetical protein
MISAGRVAGAEIAWATGSRFAPRKSCAGIRAALRGADNCSLLSQDRVRCGGLVLGYCRPFLWSGKSASLRSLLLVRPVNSDAVSHPFPQKDAEMDGARRECFKGRINSGKRCKFLIVLPDASRQNCRFRISGRVAIVILHWAIAFLCGSGGSTVVLCLVVAAASLALIPLSDWLVLNRAAQVESSVEQLEALFALDDCRGVGWPRVPRSRGSRG